MIGNLFYKMHQCLKFLPAILTIAVGSVGAKADPFHPTFYLSENSKLTRSFLQPEMRPDGARPRILAEMTNIRLEMGETILVPILSRTPEGWPLPISWALENNLTAAVGATIDKAFPYAMNGFTYSSFGFSFIIPSGIAGPRSALPAPAGIGCERRFPLENQPVFYDGLFKRWNGRTDLLAGIFLCLHGREVGKGQILVGEAVSSLDFSRRIDGPQLVINRLPYLDPDTHVSITVEVVKPSDRGLSEELSMVDTLVTDCSLEACKLVARPLNRGGEILDCNAKGIGVNWIFTSTSYSLISQTGCSVVLKPKHLPSVLLPVFGAAYQVNAIVSQTTEWPVTTSSGKILSVKTVKQAFSATFLHPFDPSGTLPVKWAMARCPIVIVPGQSFSCAILAVSEDGDVPGPFNVSPTGWSLPPGVHFVGFAKSNDKYACFTVDESIAEGELKGISGQLVSGLPFFGARMAISKAYANFLSGRKPLDCPS